MEFSFPVEIFLFLFDDPLSTLIKERGDSIVMALSFSPRARLGVLKATSPILLLSMVALTSDLMTLETGVSARTASVTEPLPWTELLRFLLLIQQFVQLLGLSSLRFLMFSSLLRR